MNLTSALAHEVVVPVGDVNPASYSAGTQTTGWIAAKNFTKFLAVIQAGALGTNATLNAKLQQASDGSGTGAKDITGKAITQFTQAGTDYSGKTAVISLDPSELDATNGFTHFRLSFTVATAASLVSASVYGIGALYTPAEDYGASDVVQYVS
jgi:hypothetical protein